MIQRRQGVRSLMVATAVLGVVLVGACTDAQSGDPVATGAGRDDGAEDHDNRTEAPPVPELKDGCDSEASIDAARATATSSAMATIDRIGPTPLPEIADDAPTVVFGEIVGIEQGEVRPVDPGESLPGAHSVEPQVQLMANIMLKVDHANGPDASAVAAQDVIAVPFTILSQAPADDAYAEHRDVTHANMVNDLRCAMPTGPAAVFVRSFGPEPSPDGPRLAELPTVLWSTNPAAVLLQTREQGIASLDAAVSVGDSTYFAGAATVEELVADLP